VLVPIHLHRLVLGAWGFVVAFYNKTACKWLFKGRNSIIRKGV